MRKGRHFSGSNKSEPVITVLAAEEPSTDYRFLSVPLLADLNIFTVALWDLDGIARCALSTLLAEPGTVSPPPTIDEPVGSAGARARLLSQDGHYWTRRSGDPSAFTSLALLPLELPVRRHVVSTQAGTLYSGAQVIVDGRLSRASNQSIRCGREHSLPIRSSSMRYLSGYWTVALLRSIWSRRVFGRRF